jgi:hypothetical protein
MVRRCPTVEGLGGRVVLSTFGIDTGLNMVATQVASFTGPGDEGPEEQITFVYGKMGVDYGPQD